MYAGTGEVRQDSPSSDSEANLRYHYETADTAEIQNMTKEEELCSHAALPCTWLQSAC